MKNPYAIKVGAKLILLALPCPTLYIQSVAMIFSPKIIISKKIKNQ